MINFIMKKRLNCIYHITHQTDDVLIKIRKNNKNFKQGFFSEPTIPLKFFMMCNRCPG